jgi:hypothetical protein
MLMPKADKKGTTQMGVQTTNPLRIRKEAPSVASYVSEEENLDATSSTEMFEPEDETEVAERSSAIQSGWSAAKKAVANASKSFTTDFKFEENVQLIKFISAEPLSFLQHWVNRPGKKSFIGWDGDPLCRVGNKPEQKFAFSVVNLTDLESEPEVQFMTVGVRLCGQLEKLNADKKTGPLNRPDIYWAVSKSGQGTKTSYSIVPVKERDLVEDWEIDPAAAAEMLSKLKPLGPEALRVSTAADLEEIAKELLAGQ